MNAKLPFFDKERTKHWFFTVLLIASICTLYLLYGLKSAREFTVEYVDDKQQEWMDKVTPLEPKLDSIIILLQQPQP